MTQNKDFESKCISKVWGYYYEKIVDHEPREIPISLLIVKLMDFLKRTRNKDYITKALLMTISFLHQIPAGDIYNNRGIDLAILPKKHKKKVIEMLRQEFLLN